MYAASEFDGGVFSEEIGGRAGARIELRTAEIVARTTDGREFTLPYTDCHLDIGGASGRMIFCRPGDRSLTIFCEEHGFLEALEHHSGGLLAVELAAIHRSTRSRRRWTLFWVAATLLVLVGLPVGAYFGIIAAGRAAVASLPITVDEQIGALAMQSIDLEGTRVEDPVINDAVGRMVDRLTPHADADSQGFKFKVHIVDAPIVNAFALPGGNIVVYTGLLTAASNAEQVAGVIAHEMAHVTCRHSLHRLSQQVGVSVALGLVVGDAEGFVALGGQVLHAGALSQYSQSQESEADAVGVRTLAGAGIDPMHLAAFFEALHDEGTSVTSWLDSHPHSEGRIAAIRRLAGELPTREYQELAIDWDEVRGAIDGLPTVNKDDNMTKNPENHRGR